MDNYALYSRTFSELPVEHIEGIANPSSFKATTTTEGSRSFIYLWDELKITINQMPSSKIEEHLQGFAGYVQHLSNIKNIPVDQVLVNRILSTSMVLGVIVEPGVDEQGRVEEVIGAIAYNTGSLMFFADSIFDENANLLLGP